MGFYDDLQATASGLLASFGAPLTFVRVQAGDYDPSTGAAAVTERTYTLNGVVEVYNNAEIDGSRVLATDRKVMVQAGTDSPAVGDTVTIDGISFRVEQVMLMSPAGTPLMYTVQVRL